MNHESPKELPTNVDPASDHVVVMLPCPFCGGKPELVREGTPRQSCQIKCEDCGTFHESSDEGFSCGRSWNRRSLYDDHMKRLQFLICQFQMHSPDMGGQHSYRFRNGGWPVNHMKGPSLGDAIDAAIKEVERDFEKSKST